MTVVENTRIKEVKELLPPIALVEKYVNTDDNKRFIAQNRVDIHNILHKKDSRLLVVVGPCSIHDPEAALEYAQRLLPLRKKHENQLEIVMRSYFEKPRTTVGWKGLINDPHLDESFHINDGLRFARKLLLNITQLNMPTATEFLDVITPQYVSDLISWGAIGARTTESQIHRELASGSSMPIGLKNGTDGNIQIALDGIRAAQCPHSFLSMTRAGHSAIFKTAGNEDCHIILRGGHNKTNFDAQSLRETSEALTKAGLKASIMVDCSHANSSKKFENQVIVSESLCEQIKQGNTDITGVMLESHLVEGKQNLNDTKALVYGQSITDGCLGWDKTEAVLDSLAEAIKVRQG